MTADEIKDMMKDWHGMVQAWVCVSDDNMQQAKHRCDAAIDAIDALQARSEVAEAAYARLAEQLARAVSAGAEWREELQHLTPLGSEYTTPAECVRYVNERIGSPVSAKSLKARIAELEPLAETGRLVNAMPVGCGLNHHSDGDGGIEWTFGRITSITVFEVGDNPANTLPRLDGRTREGMTHRRLAVAAVSRRPNEVTK